MEKEAVKALATGEKAIRPGLPTRELYAIVRSVFERRGLAQYFPHHAGHGVGLLPSEEPRVIPGSSEVLQEGMVITLEPGLYLPGQGGMRLEEPAADLAVSMALASSLANRALPSDLVAFGEVGLSGELRSVVHAAARLREAAKLGFRRAILPSAMEAKLEAVAEIEVSFARDICRALEVAFDG